MLAVGAGVPPERYGELTRLRELLGAELVGTRKVTDQGWLPRNRQVGLTGHSLSPRLYLALGVSGEVQPPGRRPPGGHRARGQP